MECKVHISQNKKIHSRSRYRDVDENHQPNYYKAIYVREINDCQPAITIPATYWVRHFQKSNSAKFSEYYDKWVQETMFESNGNKIIHNENYQKIIDLGYSVIPNIIDRFKKRPQHWSYALRKITGINLNEAELNGDLELIRQRWLTWAEDNDY